MTEVHVNTAKSSVMTSQLVTRSLVTHPVGVPAGKEGTEEGGPLGDESLAVVDRDQVENQHIQ